MIFNYAKYSVIYTLNIKSFNVELQVHYVKTETSSLTYMCSLLQLETGFPFIELVAIIFPVQKVNFISSSYLNVFNVDTY